jgi:type IV secretory pathway VirB6-like protein
MTYKVCDDTIDKTHPLPYTDQRIAQLLRSSNNNPIVTIEDIVDHYDKICITDGEGEMFWLRDGECKNDICVMHMDGYASVLCAWVITGCPLVCAIQDGTTVDPEFEKNSDGSYKIDEKTDQIVMKESSKKMLTERRYLRHCRIRRYVEGEMPTQSPLMSIFDQSCYDMRGYSKGLIPITAVVAQCVTETMFNLFQKNIFNAKAIALNKGDPGMNYKKDILMLESALSQIQAEIGINITDLSDPADQNQSALDKFKTQHKDDIQIDNKNNPQKINSIKKILENALNSKTTAISYLPTKSNIITNPIENITIYQKYSDRMHFILPACLNGVVSGDICYNDLNITMPDPSKIIDRTSIAQEVLNLSDMIMKVKDKYSSFVKSYSDNKVINPAALNTLFIDTAADDSQYTMYDMFRNRMKVIAVLAITLWIVVLGFKAMTGEIPIDIKKLLPIFLNVGICYFLIFDDSVKGWLFRMAIRVSHGVSMILFQVLEDRNNDPRSISYKFINPEYQVGTKDVNGQPVCNNAAIASVGGYYEPFCTWEDKNGKRVCKDNSVMCIPFIPYKVRPNYEHPYLPVFYSERLNTSGGNLSYGNRDYDIKVIPMYCRKDPMKPDGALEAKLMMSADLGQYIFYCDQKDYILDSGYTLKTLKDYIIGSGINANGQSNNAVYEYISNSIAKYYLKYFTNINNRNSSIDVEVALLKQNSNFENFVVSTAITKLDKYGEPEKIDFDLLALDMSDPVNNESFNRNAIKSVLEGMRRYINASADYPVVFKGKTDGVDMSYLSLFDKIDKYLLETLTLRSLGSVNKTVKKEDSAAGIEKMLKSLLVTLSIGDFFTGFFDFITFVFIGFPFGIFLAMILFMIAFSLCGAVFAACTAYVKGVIGLAFYLYIAPLMVIFNLFDQTRQAFEQWKKSIIGFVIQMTIPFFAIAILMVIYDYALFGWSTDGNYSDIFTLYTTGTDATTVKGQNSVGTVMINPDCFEGVDPNTGRPRIEQAPIACLLVKMQNKIGGVSIAILVMMIIGIFFPPFSLGAIIASVVAGLSIFDLLKNAIWRGLIAMIIVYFANAIITAIEDGLISLGLPIQKSGIGEMASKGAQMGMNLAKSIASKTTGSMGSGVQDTLKGKMVSDGTKKFGSKIASLFSRNP